MRQSEGVSKLDDHHLIPPQPVLVVAGKAVDHDGNGEGEDEDAT